MFVTVIYLNYDERRMNRTHSSIIKNTESERAGVNNVLRTSVFGLHLKRLLTVADTDLKLRAGRGRSSRP